MLVRSEHTGNWYLHLKATQDMLPCFAAVGYFTTTQSVVDYISRTVNTCVLV